MFWPVVGAAALCGLSALAFNDEADNWGDRFQMAGYVAGFVLLLFWGIGFIVWLFTA